MRTVSVPRERLARWLEGFADRHGGAGVVTEPDAVTLTAPDGAVAVVAVPFPPLSGSLVEHVARDRRVGLILVRRGGWAIGIAVGTRIERSKVGSGYVQGRTKAGGWSQQRYARRRDQQAGRVWEAATSTAVELLAGEALDAVVTGGDAPGVRAVLADPRLAAVAALAGPRTYPVPDPRLRVLQAFPEAYLAVEIGLNERA